MSEFEETDTTEIRPRRRRLARFRTPARWASVFALGVAAALVAMTLYGAMVPGSKPMTPQDVNARISQALASVTPGPALSQSAYEAIKSSLVLVKATIPPGTASATTSPLASGSAAAGSPVPSGTPLPSGISTADDSTGSGVFINASGDILTCLHIVAGASAIEVTFADGTKSEAAVVSGQPANDIAVLRAKNPPSPITPAVLGSPRSVQIGSEAYVVGSPFGLTGSMSSGVVSGLNRSFQLANGTTLTGLIQVDAAVNPGSSGGPLLNRSGQVVGIISALINPTNQGVFIGIGLAVPISVAGGAAGLPPD